MSTVDDARRAWGKAYDRVRAVRLQQVENNVYNGGGGSSGGTGGSGGRGSTGVSSSGGGKGGAGSAGGAGTGDDADPLACTVEVKGSSANIASGGGGGGGGGSMTRKKGGGSTGDAIHVPEVNEILYIRLLGCCERLHPLPRTTTAAQSGVAYIVDYNSRLKCNMDSAVAFLPGDAGRTRISRDLEKGAVDRAPLPIVIRFRPSVASPLERKNWDRYIGVAQPVLVE